MGGVWTVARLVLCLHLTSCVPAQSGSYVILEVENAAVTDVTVARLGNAVDADGLVDVRVSKAGPKSIRLDFNIIDDLAVKTITMDLMDAVETPVIVREVRGTKEQ